MSTELLLLLDDDDRDDWMLIDTEPRDGTFFIAANSTEMVICNRPDGCYRGRWLYDRRYKEWMGSFIATAQPLTHWRPLPAYPKKRK